VDTVEGSDTMAKVARKVIDTNGYNQTVNLHNKFSTSLKIGSDMPLVLLHYITLNYIAYFFDK
jgi:hypothetical protein